jgi:methyl-accepting chemotaxis protein
MKQSMVRSTQLHHITASIILVLAAVALFLGFKLLRETLAETPHFMEVSDQLRHVDMLRDAIRADVVSAVAAAARGDAQDLRIAQAQSARHKQELEQAVTRAGQLLDDPALARMFAELRPVLEQYGSEGTSIAALAEHDADAAAKRLSGFRQLVTALEKPNDQMVTATKELVNKQIARTEQAVRWLAYLLIALGVLSIFDRAIGITRARQFVVPLIGAKEMAQEIAAGNLTAESNAHAGGEAGDLLAALRNMRTSLASIVGHVRQSADGVARSSEQLRAGSTDLSQRTEEQAASLEQTAASMDELTSTVKQNADNAQQASELARTAAGLASRGGEVVSQVVKTMGGIQDSSNKIAEIITVIDSIAFQTNILALNAAVEAARAGDQGRGFAVVAAEVRNLAQRSAAAAKEIKALISGSVERVRAGSSLVTNAGQSMDEIVDSVRRVSDLIGAMAQASREQSLGIQQVSQTVVQLEQVTQQNAAVVEQVAASAESMKNQARDLLQSVSTFRLGASETSAALKPQAALAAQAAPRAAPNVQSTRPSGKLATPARPALAGKQNRKAAEGSGEEQEDDWQEF